jgi:uncharacterized protein YhaN
MQIKKLHIYRYGCFEDVVFESFSPTLQVFFGMNEAGKSTIMAFIRSVLFGFTAKSKNYASESGGTFGGSLTVKVPDKGIVTIERTGSKGKGNVNVFLENGRTAGEDELEELLRGLDVSMFEAIFSFDLDGLQGLGQIEAEEMNDYLFHAGMTGSLSIRTLEKKLDKIEGELFKPNGRKPQLNQKLNELQALEKELSQWRDHQQHYRTIIDNTTNAELRFEELEVEKRAYKENIHRLEKLKTLRPLVEEKQMWQSRLNQLSDYEDFPEDGLARFEKWQSQAVTLEAEKAQHETNKKVLLEKLDEIKPNTALLHKKEEIFRLKEEERWIEEMANGQISRRRECKTEEEELTAIFAKLGLPWDEEAVLTADTGLVAKDRLKEYSQTKERLLQRQQILDGELTRLEQAVKENKDKEEHLRDKRLSDGERKRLHQQLEDFNERSKLREEKQQLEKHLDRLQKQLKPEGPPNGRLQSFAFYGWTAFGAILCIWMLKNGLPFIGLATALLFFGFSFYVLRAGQKPTSYHSALTRDRDEIEAELEQMNHMLSQHQNSPEELERAEQLLAEDEKLQHTLFLTKDRQLQEQKTYENALVRYDRLQRDLENLKETFDSWCKRYRFPRKIKHVQLLEIFDRVEEAKRRIRNQNRLRDALQSVDRELTTRENEVKGLCDEIQLPFRRRGTAVHQLVQRLEEEERQHEEKKQLLKDIESVNEHVVAITEKIHRYNNECLRLMNRANVPDEETYRKKAKASNESRKIFEHLTALSSRIDSLAPNSEERKILIEDILKSDSHEETQILHLEERIHACEQEEKQLHKRTAELETQKQQLEEGGTHAELLHRFQQKKDALDHDARRWAVYRTAAHFLKKAKERYRSERQPKVIGHAERYFTMMTDGRYQKLYAPDGEGFVVERADGMRFSPVRLSRGTVEQLYLAIRLALARIYESLSPYPVMMDDILVNFDEKRRTSALDVIREAAQHQQMLLFTCHSHMIKHFNETEVLTIRERKTTPLTIRASL